MVVASPVFKYGVSGTCFAGYHDTVILHRSGCAVGSPYGFFKALFHLFGSFRRADLIADITYLKYGVDALTYKTLGEVRTYEFTLIGDSVIVSQSVERGDCGVISVGLTCEVKVARGHSDVITLGILIYKSAHHRYVFGRYTGVHRFEKSD